MTLITAPFCKYFKFCEMIDLGIDDLIAHVFDDNGISLVEYAVLHMNLQFDV